MSINEMKEYNGYTMENIYTKFLEDNNVKRFKELTREQFNEYQKIYYQLNKHILKQHRFLQTCDVCNEQVKNIFNHKKSKKHMRLVEVIDKYNLNTIPEN
ncbi:MAG: hypothetical protein ACO26X_03520 [Candidatus Fonsibacter ubiquis]